MYNLIKAYFLSAYLNNYKHLSFELTITYYIFCNSSTFNMSYRLSCKSPVKSKELPTFICFKSSMLTLGTSAVSETAEESEV